MRLFSLLLLGCTAALAQDPGPPPRSHIGQSDSALTERSDSSHYLVVPKDGKDSDLLHRLSGIISSTTGVKNFSSWSSRGQLKWYSIDLTASEVTKLKKSPDVKYVVRDEKMEEFRAVPTGPVLTPDAYELDDIFSPKLSKRKQVWGYQPNSEINWRPPRELIHLNTPEKENWECQSEYTYAAEAGSGIHIYHLEHGILPGFDWEFPNLAPALTTRAYDFLGDQATGPDGHSTCVATKAVGKGAGASKKATLVPVLIGTLRPSELAQAFERVLDDIQNFTTKELNPARYKKSIILLALGFDRILSAVDPTIEPWTSMHATMSDLMDLGVPLIFAAGNTAGDFPSRPGNGYNVEGYPQMWATDDFPIINVGNLQDDGQASPKSCRGSKVSIYAVGVRVLCVGPLNGESGTSFSAPLVAGSLAVFMSQTGGPFYEATKDKVGTRDFVIAVRKFLMEEASYLTSHGLRKFWNMADP